MGDALALDAAWLFAAFLLILVLLASGIAVRRFLLERGGGTVDCGLRRPAGTGAWRLGVASYQRDELHWYHMFGVLLRPEAVLERRTLTVVGRRTPTPAEAASLGAGLIVVECSVRGAGAQADGVPGRMDGSEAGRSQGSGGQPEDAGGRRDEGAGLGGQGEDADGGRVELAMSEAALTGFLAWLEAAPPGSYLDQIA
ncbi:MAG TPA: DUF2550 domain-containing protein [Streptosporangiaceae bacterium]|nr:DUF2550 domain-containing protein [Streptosporangiaceae bacterium]